MRQTVTTLLIGLSASVAQTAQTLPTDPSAWGQLAEKLGIIGLLCVVIWYLLRREAQQAKIHKEELEKRDKEIERLKEETNQLKSELKEVRDYLLRKSRDENEMTSATTRRSRLKLQESQDNADQ